MGQASPSERIYRIDDCGTFGLYGIDGPAHATQTEDEVTCHSFFSGGGFQLPFWRPTEAYLLPPVDVNLHQGPREPMPPAGTTEPPDPRKGNVTWLNWQQLTVITKAL